jgi:hypothetical protein
MSDTNITIVTSNNPLKVQKSMDNNERLACYVKAIQSNSAYSELVDLLTNLSKDVMVDTEDMSFAFFNTAMANVLRDDIKPVFQEVRNANKPEKAQRGESTKRVKREDDWRGDQLEFFGGRGRKWIYVDIDTVTPVLEELEAQGVDVTNYRSDIEAAGKAWIRYQGPRVNEGKASAMFWLWPDGSRGVVGNLDKQYHIYIDHDDITNIEFVDGTPYKLGLEANDMPKSLVAAESEPEVNTNTNKVIQLDGGGMPQQTDKELNENTDDFFAALNDLA